MTAPTSPTLSAVARGKLCTGCGLCAALAPGAVAMAKVPPGYLRPVQSQPLTVAQEAAIAATCPALLVDQQSAAKHDDPLWGPYLSANDSIMTGHATDARLRHHASSGGALSALLTHALETGQVDSVIQTAADPENPIGNHVRPSTSAEDIYNAAGSRYAPSAPLEHLEQWLARPGRLAFVGKPCDVTALRTRARHDPRIAQKIPLMLAFFCAGVPSETGAKRILAHLGAPEDDVTAFRYRGDGWPGRATATLADGTTRDMSYAESWGNILTQHVQFRCKICADAVGAAADLVCADAWDSDARGYPSFEEQQGRSLIIARTAVGQALLDAARHAGRIETTPLPLARISIMQPHQARRKQQVAARLAALALAGRPRPVYLGVGVRAAARREPLLGQLRSFGGLLRRLLKGQL